MIANQSRNEAGKIHTFIVSFICAGLLIAGFYIWREGERRILQKNFTQAFAE